MEAFPGGSGGLSSRPKRPIIGVSRRSHTVVPENGPMPILQLVLAVIGLILLRVVIALVDGTGIGRRVLAKQPDRIELHESGAQAWQDPGGAERLTAGLLELGYEPAGTFTIPEMPGVVLRLLVHVRERVVAMIYEHPKVGQWVELATRYAGGDGFAISSGHDRGLARRPGHPVLHDAGADPATLHARLLAQRPPNGMVSIEAGRAVALFEAGFAEAMAWRKSHGISRGEVVTIAVKGVPRQKAA